MGAVRQVGGSSVDSTRSMALTACESDTGGEQAPGRRIPVGRGAHRSASSGPRGESIYRNIHLSLQIESQKIPVGSLHTKPKYIFVDEDTGGEVRAPLGQLRFD